MLGGLDITVNRNFFGRQLASFEAMLPPPPAPARADAEASAATAVAADGEAKLFRGLFIRAPAIVEVGGAGGVTVLSKVRHTAGAAAASGAHFGEGEVGVAVQQGTRARSRPGALMRAQNGWSPTKECLAIHCSNALGA